METIIKRQLHPLVTPEIIKLTHSQSFNTRYFYDDWLGYQYEEQQTIFRLWSPLASKAYLVLYADTSSKANSIKKVKMTKQASGIFECVLLGDQDGLLYGYELYFEEEVTLTTDPYAKASTVNGQHSVVLSAEKMKIKDFGRVPSFKCPNEAIIYELHIRDFTIAKEIEITQKGKYLGVVEAGKTLHEKKIGLDYLKELGVTHVQLLPIFDYQTVDETQPAGQYNWGYDPQNYNVPEGSYSSDPFDPACRIRELKQMIKTLHDNGLRVIMDVVYNHVFDARTHPFNNIVPSYYFRYEPDFTPANGTACGNDTASEQPMMRQYIVDSVRYWAENFHLDGFRFDLMGNHDIETMQHVRKMLDTIDPGIIILGEGWDLETPLLKQAKATQINAEQMPRIAHFNDSLRDAVKGSVFYAEQGGLVNSEEDNTQLVWANMQGATNLSKDLAHYSNTEQVVQYVEAHDNLTLFDKLVKTNPDDTADLRRRRFMVATAIPLLSQGIAFIHAGQEFMRTKNGDGNSYRSGDEINQMNWEQMTKSSVLPFIKKLIVFRKNTPSLHLSDPAKIAEKMQLRQAANKIIIFDLLGEENYQIIINANLQPFPYSVTGKVILASSALNSKVEIPAMSVTIVTN